MILFGFIGDMRVARNQSSTRAIYLWVKRTILNVKVTYDSIGICVWTTDLLFVAQMQWRVSMNVRKHKCSVREYDVRLRFDGYMASRTACNNNP